MICDQCEVAMESRQATRQEPYRYELGGGFRLSGIKVYRCPQCRMEAPVIPQIRALHRLMAKMIAGKAALLEGPEVRFLRKSAGLSSKDCAEALGVTATYLSNVESGRANIGRPADRLLRLLGTRPVDPKAELMRLAAAARESGKAPARRETYWRHGWKPAA